MSFYRMTDVFGIGVFTELFGLRMHTSGITSPPIAAPFSPASGIT